MEQQYKQYGFRWVILAIYMYVSALTQLFWLNFAVIETYVEDMLHMPASNLQWLTLVFPLVQVILTIPAGIIIDKIGFKWGVGIGAIFTGVFSLLRLAAPESFTILLISQIGISIGQPFVLNGITKLATVWFSPKEEGTAVGLGSLALFIGMIIAFIATPAVVVSLGYVTMLWIYGIAGILGALVFLLAVKSKPATPSRAPEADLSIASWGGLGVIFKNRNFLMLGFVALVGIGAFNGLATWLEKILLELHSIPMTEGSAISAAMIVAGAIGCFVIPLISDKVKRRKPFLILASLVGAICVTALIFIRGYDINMINGILLGFFLISALPIMLTMSAEITGSKYAGVSVGFLQLMGNLAAVILVPSMEGLQSSTGNFSFSLALLVVLLIGSFLVSLWIKETYQNT
ncbi:MAG: MFS transporter [Dehalococcoidia bacterium]|nr:MAG: MFS transporter [Dehalococcoidia bacterium]